jgi:8-oxo-dGTP pyrophosphatase MutT (NUDIX family)
VPRLRRGSSGADSVLAGPSRRRRQSGRFQQPRPPTRWLLRRRLPGALALSRIPGLIARLAERTPRQVDLPDRPKAAVAVILAPNPDSILLIRRAEREGDRWSGQIALPGGRWSAGDPDLAATAHRETLEEVGVDLTGVPVVAVLDDLAPQTPVLPPIVVRPFVFAIPAPVALTPNAEVAGAWWMPLETLLQPELLRPMEYERYGTRVRGTGYHLDVGVLWGMTERILTPVLELLR